MVLGVQDISQITADYGEKEAEKIIALPANVFVGASSVKTAEKYNKEFGREFRRQESQTRSVESESVSISYHEEEIMPIRKITSLPQGTFIGKVAVDNGSPVEQPFFCASIQIDMEEYKRRKAQEKETPVLSDFELGDLWQQVNLPGVGCAYVKDYIEKQVRKEWKPKMKALFSKASLEAEVETRFSALSDEQCTEILKELMPDIERMAINRRMEENFYAIRGHIKQLIEMESPPEEEEEYSAEQIPADEPNNEKKDPKEDTREDTCQRDLQRKIIDLSLSSRTKTALVAAGIERLGDLAIRRRDDVLAIKMIGKSAMSEIEELLKTYSLEWESDLTQYGFTTMNNEKT